MNFVLAITGASGTGYAIRLAQVMLRQKHRIDLVVSDAARQVALREIGRNYPDVGATSAEWRDFFLTAFTQAPASGWGFAESHSQDDVPDESAVRVYSVRDYSAGIASGSHLTDGMVICPCSMGTLSSIAGGASSNLVQRAADVHLKERRRLILVPRETPLGLIALENMTRLTQAGATILPSMPGFYQHPACIADLIDFVVARICDQLKIEHALIPRWGQAEG